MLDAINHIEDFSRTITSASDLRDRPLERAGIERMLTIIGEAAKNVSSSLRKEYPDIPWKATAGMRDKIMHHYFGVDYEAVFETIRNDLPVLKTGVVAILSGESHKQGKKKNAQRKTG
nr:MULTISPECIES: HepT-like ribonuclease domain-containing protein [unclassified Methanoregula]